MEKENVWYERPWGRYKILWQTCVGEVGETTFHPNKQLKVLEIYEGQTLSLQLHKNRTERWNILEIPTNYCITIDNNDFFDLCWKSSFRYFIDKFVLHSAGNRGKGKLVILEYSEGDIWEEDILRFQDQYGRPVVEYDRNKVPRHNY